MGLLDDAIREHLELKRAHGADPNEVERQEREALGAPGHGEFASPSEGRRPRTRPPPSRRPRRPSSRPATWSRSPRPRPNRSPSPSPRTRGSRTSRTRSRRTTRWSIPSRPRRRNRRTCSRTRPTSCRRRPSTTACGSSSAPRGTSTGTSRFPPTRPDTRPAGLSTACTRPTTSSRPPAFPVRAAVTVGLVTPDRGVGDAVGWFSCPGAQSPPSGRLTRHGPRGYRRAARSRWLS